MIDALRPKRPFRFPASATMWCAFITIWAGLLLSVLAFFFLRREEAERADMYFRQEARERFEAFNSGINEITGTLSMLNRLFTETGGLSREQFHFYSWPLLEQHQHILALTYHGIAKVDGPSAPEASMPVLRRAGLIRAASGGASLAGGREQHRTVQFVEMTPANRILFGDDVATVTASEEGASGTNGKAGSASLWISPLAQHIGGEPAFTVTMPVFGKSAGNGEIVGHTNAVFRIRDLADQILRQAGFLADPGIGIALYKGGSEADADPVFVHGSLAPGGALFEPDGPRVSRTFNMAGQEWRMVVSASHSVTGLLHAGSWLVLVSGFLITILVAACFQILGTRTIWLKNANEALKRDMAMRKRIERELRKSQVELRELAIHQERVREDERKRIAREIHDDLGQNLLALRIELSLLSGESGGTPNGGGNFDSVFSQLDRTMKSVRSIINDLRPGVLDLGLHAAIEWQVAEMNRRYQVAFELVEHGADFGSGLSDEEATSVFRIVQESMTNVVRHANARSARVRLAQQNGVLAVEISDDGVGSSQSDQRKPRSFGLIGIKERVSAMGGEFAMASIPGKGTILSVSIPTGQRHGTSPQAARSAEDSYAI